MIQRAIIGQLSVIRATPLSQYRVARRTDHTRKSHLSAPALLPGHRTAFPAPSAFCFTYELEYEDTHAMASPSQAGLGKKTSVSRLAGGQ